MGVADLIQKFQFVVDSNGEKQSVLIDYAVWEELLNLLEDIEVGGNWSPRKNPSHGSRLRELNTDV